MSTAAISASIWAAVDRLTQPHHETIHLADGSETRALMASLWQQSSDALTSLVKSGDGASQARERSPLDLTLMEIRLTISECLAHELHQRKVVGRPTVPLRMRQLASHVIGHEPEELWWWEYRFASWARLLAGYLHAYDHTAVDVRLRNAPCPKCGTRQLVIDADEGRRVVPPILIDFENGFIRAAQCGWCGASWWRGEELQELADLLALPLVPIDIAV